MNTIKDIINELHDVIELPYLIMVDIIDLCSNQITELNVFHIHIQNLKTSSYTIPKENYIHINSKNVSLFSSGKP